MRYKNILSEKRRVDAVISMLEALSRERFCKLS